MSRTSTTQATPWQRLCLGLLLAIGLCGCDPRPETVANAANAPKDSRLTVFAAASGTTALSELAVLYEARSGVSVITSFAASSTLAMQIGAGAPADIFLSANARWTDHLERRGHLVAGTRYDLLSNRVVLIAPADGPIGRVMIDSELDLAGLLGPSGRLAMGDPAHVPAGLYGKEALESLGLWAPLAPRIAPMANVRAALAMVERGGTPLGIVYASDATVSEKVQVVGTFPASTHRPIVYPIAIVQNAEVEPARAFLDFLKTADARSVFRKHGFAPIGDPASDAP